MADIKRSSPPSQVDNRRAFWGKPLLTDYEIKVLAQIRRKPLRVIIKHGRPEYWCGAIKIRRDTAKRLIDFGHVVPLDEALLPGLSHKPTARDRHETAKGNRRRLAHQQDGASFNLCKIGECRS